MSIYKHFQQALDQQLENLARLPEISRANIDFILDKLRQNRFNLVMLGAFKRGKSTLASIRQALDRALAQKQVSDQNAVARLGELDQRLIEILQVESSLLSLKENIMATLH